MAKEFKEFDKQFEAQAATEEEIAVAKAHSRWPYEVCSWSHREVREAVYHAEGWEEWQKLRVGMKGVSTRVKILRLERYLMSGEGRTKPKWIRIDNYIKALARGGLLTPVSYAVINKDEGAN
jgi:hypothetical protein